MIAKVATKSRLREQRTDVTYWRTQPMLARWVHLEALFQEHHAEDPIANPDFKEFVE